MTSTVLVSGGAGFVGTVLTERLLNLGYPVKVLDTFWFGDFLGDAGQMLDGGAALDRGDEPRAADAGVEQPADLLPAGALLDHADAARAMLAEIGDRRHRAGVVAAVDAGSVRPANSRKR